MLRQFHLKKGVTDVYNLRRYGRLPPGALIPLMAIWNAGLARASGGTIQATVLLFAHGELLGSLVLAAITRAQVPAIQNIDAHCAASVCRWLDRGILYLEHHLSCAPRFGVGNAILFAVTAQLLTSALIDHFALAGASLRPLTTLCEELDYS